MGQVQECRWQVRLRVRSAALLWLQAWGSIRAELGPWSGERCVHRGRESESCRSEQKQLHRSHPCHRRMKMMLLVDMEGPRVQSRQIGQ